MSVAARAFLIALLAIFATLGLRIFRFWSAKQQMQSVLSGLRGLENSVPYREKPTRVAVGLGACMDVFIDAVPFLEKMNVTPSNGGQPPEHLKSIEDLEKSFSYFFKDGVAAERHLNNKRNVSVILKFLRESKGRWALGGNAPVMGNRFAKEGCKVLLGAKTSDLMRSHYHVNMTGVAQKSDTGDVHVILEYKIGDKWGTYEAPRANRYIFHGDQDNPYLAGLEEFESKIGTFKPDLVVIGGLQMMDNFPYKPNERLRKLKSLENLLKNISKSTPIHFEMASFIDNDLFSEILTTVIPYADSIGMNEQELPNLVSMLATGEITMSASAYPRTAVMLDGVRSVFDAVDKAKRGAGQRRLSRLHLHTIGYQVVAVRGNPHFVWRHTRAAAAKASLTANRHTCGLKDIDIERSKMLVDDSFSISAETRNSPRVHFNATEPVSCWKEGAITFCVAPVLVCTQVKMTAGGGDNISAATLAVQI